MAASLLELPIKISKKTPKISSKTKKNHKILSLWMILKNWQNLPIELKPLPSILKIRFSKKQ
jgi:hypothetical protein